MLKLKIKNNIKLKDDQTLDDFMLILLGQFLCVAEWMVSMR